MRENLKYLKMLILGSQLLASVSIAGGGGYCPPPHSGDILVCHPQQTNEQSNIVGMTIYHTDGCDNFQRTFAQFDIVESDLSYVFQIADGIDEKGTKVIGNHQLQSILVSDPRETIGYQSSGVFANIDTTITSMGAKSFRIDGLLHVIRAKNEAVNGPDFPVHGVVVCD